MKWLWSSVAMTAALHAAASAQVDSELGREEEPVGDTIVVTGELDTFSATKAETPIVETARSISIETAGMFEDKGAQTLSQALTYMAGVAGEPYGFSTRGDFITSRGLSIPRYRDSIQELFGSYNSTRADVYTIEQVEVLKGPASVLYGQGSPGGLVNYVSKTPQEFYANEIVLEAGNFERRRIAGDFTGPVPGTDGKLLYRLVGVYRDQETQIEEVGDETYVLMPSLTFAPREDTRFTLIGLIQETDSDTAAQFIPVEGTLEPLPGGGYLDRAVYAGEPGFNRFDTESEQVTLLAEHRVNDALKFEATALWRSGEADYHQAWPTFTGAGVTRYLNGYLGTDAFTPTTVARTFYQADNTFDQLAADIRAKLDAGTGPLRHQILVGAQLQDVETDSNNAYYTGGGALTGDFRYVLDLADPVYTGAPDQSVFDAIYTDQPTQNVQDLGLYLSDQISYGNWRLTLGARYDETDTDNGAAEQEDDAVSYSAGLLYRFENGFAPYVSYAESFEPVIGTTLDGSQLDPEEGRQYEAGIKYEPRGFPALITASVFDIEISNLPNPNALPADASQQQGVSKIKGAEVEAQVQMGDVYLDASYSVLDAEDPNGQELAAQPEELASLWAMWQPRNILDGFKIGAGIRHVGESTSETASLRYVTPSYTLGDAMIGWETERWEATINARNVTDEDYLTACLTRGDCFPGLERTVVGTVRVRF
ncbi:TonB-dependent siderophore receptor [Parvularcula oceani]|uniref:TonB-dependent siderophore receptor n=1 Tax=Parvularcula oceani TaxID=1247963 RepID=UPI000ACB3112|nr:TonB-dependent siderophore receptor [Parvularcula oceani]